MLLGNRLLTAQVITGVMAPTMKKKRRGLKKKKGGQLGVMDNEKES
jgi:hypothetical protein